MSELQFWVKNPNDQFQDFNTRLDPDGLSFYSSKSAKAHQVGVFNEKTVVYNKKYRGKDVNNVKFIHSSSGQVDDYYTIVSSPTSKTSAVLASKRKSPTLTQDLPLNKIPNHTSTINVRFVSDASVQVQNASVKIASLSSDSTTPSNLNFKIAQIMHPEYSPSAVGSGDSSWTDVPANSSASAKNLTDNPGISGIATGVSSVRHDWYLALSGQSTDIGEGNFQLIFSLEYV